MEYKSYECCHNKNNETEIKILENEKDIIDNKIEILETTEKEIIDNKIEVLETEKEIINETIENLENETEK